MLSYRWGFFFFIYGDIPWHTCSDNFPFSVAGKVIRGINPFLYEGL